MRSARFAPWFLGLALLAPLAGPLPAATAQAATTFRVEETTIAEIHRAILAQELTTTELVRLYLKRIQAYNGPGVEMPAGLLGPFTPVARAKGINALGTLNLRPAARRAWGFDERKARSLTDAADADPAMPDALEVAARLDAEFARTGKLVGPLHGVVIAIKDQYDTFDLRTTSGADAAYANDRPPDDATFVKRLREAGAIIIGKANMGEYASGFRSSFGGVLVNPYDTERNPGGSSGGSATAVAANLCTVAIAEETGPSVRAPAQYANTVGLAPTQELVSRDGMVNIGLNTRTGPVARTVADAARVLSVIAGYDEKDEMTAFAVGRLPARPYEDFARPGPLAGLRIGVVREYLDRSVFGAPEEENIALVERAIDDLRQLGATVVEPGPEGLFTPYIRRHDPLLHNATWTKRFPELFPVDDKGRPSADHVAKLVDLAMNPATLPGKATLRDFPAAPAEGESKYGYNLYLAQRGDARIRTLDDLISKANFYVDSADEKTPPKKATLENANKPLVYDTALRMQRRFAIQQIVLQCMAEQKLDALVAPTGLNPPRKLLAPNEPNANGKGNYGMFTFLGQQGFPVMTVPAGFTTRVYDQVPDPAKPGAHVWSGPTPARLPVGVDFIARPFGEPIIFQIAAAYEAATKHRRPPPDFGPLE